MWPYMLMRVIQGYINDRNMKEALQEYEKWLWFCYYKEEKTHEDVDERCTPTSIFFDNMVSIDTGRIRVSSGRCGRRSWPSIWIRTQSGNYYDEEKKITRILPDRHIHTQAWFTPRPDFHQFAKKSKKACPCESFVKVLRCELHSFHDFDQIKAQPPIIKIINLMQMISYSVQVITRYFSFHSKR